MELSKDDLRALSKSFLERKLETGNLNRTELAQMAFGLHMALNLLKSSGYENSLYISPLGCTLGEAVSKWDEAKKFYKITPEDFGYSSDNEQI